MINTRSKGQAFMTFKILIAAIVAMAILALLLPMISNLSGLIGEKPSEEITRLAQSGLNNLGSSEGKELSFTGTLSIVPQSIANKLGYSEGHVCFNVEAVTGNNELAAFSNSKSGSPSDTLNPVIAFDSTGSLKVDVTVGCNDGESAAAPASDTPAVLASGSKDGNKTASDYICKCSKGGVCCGVLVEQV